MRLLTPEEAAEILGVTKRYLLKLGIRRVHLGHRTIRFRLEDIEAFLNDR